MDHDEAVRAMAAERYLLNDLTAELREEFEEHFFVCQPCAADVRAGAAFLEHSKSLLSAETVEPAAAMQTSRAPRPVWLRAWFAVPAMALLVALVAYQGLVLVPGLRRSVVEPHVLPALSLINVATRGGNTPVVSIHSGSSFLLFVDIAAGAQFSSYQAELYSPSGEREWSLPISAQTAHDTVSIEVPAGLKMPGVYKLTVRGTSGDGHSSEVGTYPFELQFN